MQDVKAILVVIDLMIKIVPVREDRIRIETVMEVMAGAADVEIIIMAAMVAGIIKTTLNREIMFPIRPRRKLRVPNKPLQ
jgi:hypothetical protein